MTRRSAGQPSGHGELPTADAGRNTAWLHLAAIAVTLTAWLRHLALDGEQMRFAEPKSVAIMIRTYVNDPG